MNKITYRLCAVLLFCANLLNAQRWVENTAATGLLPVAQYLKVSDALGQIVFEKKEFDSGTTSQSIDLKDVANGLYFIEVQNQNNRSVEKLMIQH